MAIIIANTSNRFKQHPISYRQSVIIALLLLKMLSEESRKAMKIKLRVQESFADWFLENHFKFYVWIQFETSF